MKPYTPEQIEALTNWDGMLCKPPWRNVAEKRQYYGRFVERMLWRYLTTEQWQELASVVDELRVPEKLKLATKFLIPRHV